MTTAVSPGAAVAALCAAVDQVLGAAWWRCADAGVREAVAEVERQAARLDAGRLWLLAEAGARGVGAAEGATSTAECAATAVSRRERAGERVALADALSGPLAATGAALAAGAMTGDHAAVISRAMTKLPRDLDARTREQAEHFLVEQARVLDPAQLARVAKVLRRRLDGDAGERAEREEEAALEAEELTLVQDDDGRWLGAPPACGGGCTARSAPRAAPRCQLRSTRCWPQNRRTAACPTGVRPAGAAPRRSCTSLTRGSPS